ncbi:MAG TPA: hypothetical protein P5509_09410 [Bacteroidales bacterium]|nr:hypothetical protein [Bacteroidales bacterium]
MKKRIPTIDEFINESVLNEADTYKYKGDEYAATFHKHKDSEGVAYSLILKSKKTGEFLVFPRVFWYTEGWSQGTGRSEHGYYLNTKGYGSQGNGSGQRSPSIPYYINDEIEYILNSYNGKGYNKDMNKWYQDHAMTYPKGTKIANIKNELKYL